jgi:putative ABC transport system permease protein
MRFVDTVNLARGNVGRTPLRTALTATGIAIGTAAVVTLLALGNGIQAIAVGQAATFSAVTSVLVFPGTSGGRVVPVLPEKINAVRSYANVTRVVTSLNTPPLRLALNGMSVDVQSTAKSPIADGATLVAGATGGSAEADGVLVPKSLLPSLGATPASIVGASITLIEGGDVCCTDSQSGGITVLGPEKSFTAHVAGVTDDSTNTAARGRGPNEIKQAPAIIVAGPLGASIDGAPGGMTGAQYLDRQGYASAIVVTDDARVTAGVATRIKAMGLRAQDRGDLLARIDFFFNIIKGGLGAIGGIALLVATVGIANTMIMTVLERTREIGIMKALGAEPRTIRLLFLTETALNGVIGGVAGLLLAFAASFLLNFGFTRFIQGQGGTVPGSLVVIPPVLVLGALALAIVVSLIGGALPSRRAVRLQPLDALRYE